MDETFAVAPCIYTQLFIIHAELGTTAVLCVYGLLCNKAQSAYKVQRAILTKCEELGFYPDPTTVICDFE